MQHAHQHILASSCLRHPSSPEGRCFSLSFGAAEKLTLLFLLRWGVAEVLFGYLLVVQVHGLRARFCPNQPLYSTHRRFSLPFFPATFTSMFAFFFCCNSTWRFLSDDPFYCCHIKFYTKRLDVVLGKTKGIRVGGRHRWINLRGWIVSSGIISV